MKKKIKYIALILLLCNTSIHLIAQNVKNERIPPATRLEQSTQQKGISNIPDCFCCDGAYNLTPPVISGPDTARCGTTVTFKWPYNCTGVIVGHNFSPFPPGASGGGNNNSVSFNIPPGYTGNITLTVSFNCGGKSVTSQKVFTVVCCDCNLPPKFDIAGPRALCVGGNCKDDYVYTVPNMNDGKCYTYNWSISPAVRGFSGQGTNSIRIKCSALAAGTYTITSQIKCGDKVVNSTAQVVACQKPNAAFAPQPNPANPSSGVLVPGTTYSSHFWYVVTDNDNSGDYSNGDTYIGPLTGSTANFSSLIVGKRYVFYHFVMNQCEGFACWSSTYSSYGFNPSSMRVAPNGNKEEGKPEWKKMGEKNINLIKEIPEELLRKLPADKVELMKKSEYVGHVTLMK